MDIKTGLAVQAAGHRSLNQVPPVPNAPADSVAPAVAPSQTPAAIYAPDSTAFEARQTPSLVSLVEQTTDFPKITVGTKVLIIGDSQTVGPYGKTLDGLARATGATVSTHASWGASPYWFFNGNQTYKYWNKDTTGQEATGTQVNTPLLKDLLSAQRPDVVVVTMGGNMIAGNASQGEVTKQVSEIGNAVSASGAHLVWVGPPKYDPQKRSPEVVEQFYQKLGNIVPEFGTLIDSRPHVSEYAGSDGLHYSGAKGEAIARGWAKGVFGEIQKLGTAQPPRTSP